MRYAISLLMILLSSHAWSATVIDHTNWVPSGQVILVDGTTGVSLRQPSFEAAVSALTDGDAIRLGPGTYTLTAQQTITEDNIAIIGSGRGITRFTGNYAGAFLLLSGTRNRIANLTYTNIHASGIGIQVDDGVSDTATEWLIENCDLVASDDLIASVVVGQIRGRVVNCNFFENGGSGTTIDLGTMDAGSNVEIVGCLVETAATAAIRFSGLGGSGVVRDTRVVGSGGASLVQASSASVFVQNVEYDASLESGTITPLAADNTLSALLTVDGTSSGLDADLLRATTPTAAGLALLDDADASAQRTTLGLGTLATQNTVSDLDWSGADLAVNNGGTGANTAAGARTNLGVETANQRAFQPIVFAPAVAHTTGDGKVYWAVPSFMGGWDITAASALVQTAGVTNTLDIQINNSRAGDVTTSFSVASGATTGTAVIDTATDDLQDGDVLRIDIDAVHDTPGQGLVILIEAELP